MPAGVSLGAGQASEQPLVFVTGITSALMDERLAMTGRSKANRSIRAAFAFTPLRKPSPVRYSHLDRAAPYSLILLMAPRKAKRADRSKRHAEQIEEIWNTDPEGRVVLNAGHRLQWSAAILDP
jgi:hypothetical protein